VIDPKVHVGQPPLPSTPAQPLAKSVALPKSGPASAVLEQEVRIAAYELYERRGGTPEHAVEDWLTAEAHLVARRSRAVGS
jgi:Protein of unknown function (DUF2934)